MSPFLLNWLKIGLVLLAAISLMAGLAYYQKRTIVHAEWIRKLMHVGSGLIALTLPWLFAEVWPVVVLTVLAMGAMVAVRRLRRLRGNLGQVTGAVMRASLGEVMFPLGAGTIFVLADGDKLLYSIPILILTFADSSAALIGIFYGTLRYTTSDGAKTLEGSLAFFQTAFLSTLAPLLIFSDVGRTETLLIALLMGVLSMLFDAMAWWGLDNFLIPVFSFLLLRTFVTLDATTLAIQLLVTLGMIFAALYWRKRTTLNDSAALGTVVYGYFCWTLRDWLWVLPPLILFLSYNLLSPVGVKERVRPFNVQVMLGVGAVGLFWLIVADMLNSNRFFYPFSLSFSAQLAMIDYARQRRANQGTPKTVLLVRSVTIGWLLTSLPLLWVLRAEPGLVWMLLAGLAATAAGVVVFALSQTGTEGYRNTVQRWLIQTLCAALTSLLGFAAIQMF